MVATSRRRSSTPTWEATGAEGHVSVKWVFCANGSGRRAGGERSKHIGSRCHVRANRPCLFGRARARWPAQRHPGVHDGIYVRKALNDPRSRLTFSPALSWRWAFFHILLALGSALGWPPGGSGSALGDFGGATGVEKWGADPYGVGQEATSAPAGTTPGLGRTEADARQESAVACPLVDAERRSLAELEGEYEASATLRGKIAALRRRLGDGRAFYRRVRGDGNCFFRGASFAYLESVALAPHDVRRAEAARLHAALGAARPKMCAAGMLELVFEDQLEMLQEWAVQLGKGDLPPEVLLAHFNDDVTSNSVVMFLRMLASSEMAAREDFFAPFVADDTITFATFRNKTEAMGEESDHPAIVALSDALGVSLRVIYLDASGGDQAEANTIDFTPESAGKDIVPITLMYRCAAPCFLRGRVACALWRVLCRAHTVPLMSAESLTPGDSLSQPWAL